MRTRAEIEAEIKAKRKERLLYVSPEGVKGVHDAMNDLLTEWEEAKAAELQEA